MTVPWTLKPLPLEFGNRLKRSQLILHVYFCFRLVSKASALLLLLNVLWSIIPRTRSTWCWKQQWFNMFVKCRTCSLGTWVLRLVTVLTVLELFLFRHTFLHGCCVILLCWNGEICCARKHDPEIGILPEDGQPARLEVVGVPRAVENAQMELQQHRQGKLVMLGNVRNCFLAAPFLAFGDILLHCCMFRNHKW